MKLCGSTSITVAAMVAAPRLAWACAMCGLPPNDHESHAFNTSVLFMLSAPYAIAGMLGAILFVSYRIAIKKRRAATAEWRSPASRGAAIVSPSEATP